MLVMVATSTPFSSYFLFINLLMYIAVAVIAGWAINYGINETFSDASIVGVPARFFPIYYPIGNLATGFFVIFSLVAGVVGTATSLAGLQDVMRWDEASLLSASASSFLTWGLTLLAMGLACKEITIGWRPASLRALETLTIVLSGTQLLCSGAINADIAAAAASPSAAPLFTGGRV